MENVFKYYEFSEFFTDNSETFQNNEICYTELNEHHFLIFEKNKSNPPAYNLYVSKYTSKKEIGVAPPEIIELLVNDYDKSKSEHRIVLRKYLY